MRPLNGWYDEELAVSIAPLARRRWASRAAHSLCEETGLDDPIAAMKRLAVELVDQSRMPRPGKKLAMLASLQDIRNIEVTDMPEAGRLIPTRNGLVIQVNAAHSLVRRNFTICHEIAHTLVPSYHDGSKWRTDVEVGAYSEEDEEEYLCDIGAAELLMPCQEFQSALDEGTARGEVLLTLLPGLAAEFAASLEAAGIRIVRVRKAHLALIVWHTHSMEAAHQDAGNEYLLGAAGCKSRTSILPPLRVQYACRTGEMENHFFPGDVNAPLESLIVQAQREQSAVSGYQELTTKRGAVRFWTQSRRFALNLGGIRNNRVFTFLSPYEF